MRIGVFHPSLSVCGGAEWVAVNIMNTLSSENHEITALVNERIDQKKIEKILGCPINIDKEYILPMEFFPPCNPHNVYTDIMRTFMLKNKCDLVVDTYSNALLPGVNITYIHFPLSGLLKADNFRSLNTSYFIPYLLFERREVKKSERLIISNSGYTANVMFSLVGVLPSVLYPPISKVFYSDSKCLQPKENLVVCVSRIDPWKRLTMVPAIAKLTDNRIRFLIIGLRQSAEELDNILKLIGIYNLADRVEVRTNVSQEQLLSVLKRSKVFLHTAEGEHFGISIAQAMASGCIPIVHDSGGPREFVPEEYRFSNLVDAAEKIEREVFDWTSAKSSRMTSLAKRFSGESFSARFIEMFLSRCRKMKHS